MLGPQRAYRPEISRQGWLQGGGCGGRRQYYCFRFTMNHVIHPIETPPRLLAGGRGGVLSQGSYYLFPELCSRNSYWLGSTLTGWFFLSTPFTMLKILTNFQDFELETLKFSCIVVCNLALICRNLWNLTDEKCSVYSNANLYGLLPQILANSHHRWIVPIDFVSMLSVLAYSIDIE